jgi:hypothetical protein
MQYLDAIQLIRKHYNTTEFTNDIEIIKINKLLDFSNYYFIVISNDNGNAVLTDMAKTNDLFNKPEAEWRAITNRFGLNLDNYEISTPFNKIEDLYNFISLLDWVVENN